MLLLLLLLSVVEHSMLLLLLVVEYNMIKTVCLSAEWVPIHSVYSLSRVLHKDSSHYR